MPDAEASVSERKRISAVWLIPIVALLLGVWMVIYTLQSEGPEITIVFDTAEGIEAGETKIKVLSVEVGIVDSAGLTDDLGRVVVTAQLDKAATSLLREDTQFWVVRPRIGATGISGLGTALSGAYIELEPGTGEGGRRDFEGLEDPPVTPVGTAGLHLELVSQSAGSVSTADPILYKGFRVGRIESAELDVPTQKMHYRAFIDAPYDELVSSSTRFWNASGISLRGTAAGIELEMASLETLLLGGVALGLPEGVSPGSSVSPGSTFQLYPSYAKVNEQPYETTLEYVVSFAQSVRGLQTGAPVEYRGIPVGRVARVLLEELTDEGLTGSGDDIPVLLQVEPGRMKLPDDEEGAAALEEVVRLGVGNGLRATLATGSLITGSLFVAMDYYTDAPAAELGSFAGRPTIPTVASGLEGIAQQVTVLLAKVNALPLEKTIGSANRILADLDAIVASRGMQELPATLEGTLVELRETLDSVSADSPLQGRLLRTATELERSLQSLRRLLETLEDQPNALIFSRPPGEDPEPPSGSP